MAKEVLIYGQISSYSSQLFIETINDILEKDSKAELTARVNTNGGDVDYAWGAITKFKEFPNKKSVIVDGKAQSMGLFFLVYADDVKAADFANFLLHRASYPSWVENDENYFTPSRKALLDDANKKLRTALEAKIDIAAFEKITGVTLDQVFSMEGVLDVPLTAAQAKKIGLVNSLYQVTPKKAAEITALMIEKAAEYNGFAKAANSPEEKPKKTIMTLAELKAEHPALFAEVVEIGVAKGAAAEKERIEVWAHYMEVDAKAVKEGIASGKPMTQLQGIELSEKKFSKKAETELEEDSEKKKIPTGGEAASGKTKEELEKEAFQKEVLASSTVLAKK